MTFITQLLKQTCMLHIKKAGILVEKLIYEVAVEKEVLWVYHI